jgi:hypothetical protein
MRHYVQHWRQFKADEVLAVLKSTIGEVVEYTLEPEAEE